MTKITNLIKNNYLIIILLILGSFLKAPAIWESYPIIYNIDEPYLINSGLRVLNNIYLHKSLEPGFYDWGSFPIYICAFLNSFLILSKYLFFNSDNLTLEALSYSIERIDFHIINRIFSFLLMNISIYIIFCFCKKNFNFIIAILSSIILILSPKYFSLSTLATVDHWNVFFSILIIYYSFEIQKNFKSSKNFIIYGVILGCSVATKYYNFLFAAPILTIFIIKIFENNYPYKQFFLMFITSLLTFLICMPYSLINLVAFREAIVGLYAGIQTGRVGEYSNINLSYIILFKYFFSMKFVNTFVSILSVISFYFYNSKNKKEYLILISYPILFIIFIGFFKSFATRNLISLLPFIAILASISFYNLYFLLRNQNLKRFLIVFLFLIFIPTIKINFLKVKNSFLEDTRYVSLKWIKNNISPNDQILAGHYSPPVWNLKSFRDARKLWFIGDFEKNYSIREIDEGAKYIVLSSGAYGPYFNDDGSLVKIYEDKGGKLYLNFFNNNQLIKSFKPDYEKTTGPEIRIYLNKLYKKN